MCCNYCYKEFDVLELMRNEFKFVYFQESEMNE